ncbi:helix-turn-helix domain-containing protein [Amycolatopsis magusensis]|uniref:helix-turn-helix domain-containing protein n=1 Tax=Amycolatopsis magusensis TaxID=882444 RepID=UPI0037AB5FCA
MAREEVAIADLRVELGEQLGVFRKVAELTQLDLAVATHRHRTNISHLENGRAQADEDFWRTADERCQAGGVLIAAYQKLEAAKLSSEQQRQSAELARYQDKAASYSVPSMPAWGGPEALTDETAALELIRRVNASDVGDETLTRLEAVVDDLAIAYSVTPPAELLVRVRQYLTYVMGLMDARKTLAEHRRLLVIGGWLSLLAATVHIDLKQPAAATARLRTAASLAKDTEHHEIRAWCYETEAWRVLTDGYYERALELSKRAQAFAPMGSSIAIQSTAQEGRAHARLGNTRETYDALERVEQLVSPLPMPERPEHHYRYDPTKAVAYTATTLAWVGDPAAERYAREIIARLAPSDDVAKWPRRVAAANLDLALTLLGTDRLEEACDATQRAISSGSVVPSNHWRAAEVVQAVEARRLPEATDLREAYEAMRRS